MKLHAVETQGDAIKKRGQLGITQEALCKFYGISLQRLNYIETGIANPTWQQITKILLALGWSIELKRE